MEESRTAIIAAFLANLGIAVAKLVGFLVTGAASLAAEAVHSLADTANQGLLFLGGERAKRAPDSTHPFGYGRERYFWAFVVALLLFTAGGLFALFEAEEKLRHPHELESLGWAVGILLVAMVLEGLSLRTAVRESRQVKGDLSWRGFVLHSKHAELPVVLLEDSGALIGLGFALTGVTLAAATGSSRFDALGSLGIGILLVVIALTLATKMKSLLIGEAGSPDQVAAVRSAIEDHRPPRSGLVSPAPTPAPCPAWLRRPPPPASLPLHRRSDAAGAGARRPPRRFGLAVRSAGWPSRPPRSRPGPDGVGRLASPALASGAPQPPGPSCSPEALTLSSPPPRRRSG